MPAIIKNYLDFEILPTENPKILIFIDASEYIDERPEKPILEILLPGFNRSFVVNIIPKKINILNANTIGITKTFINNYNCLTDLPDGVWTLTYMICPYDLVSTTKHILRDAQLLKKLDELYRLLDLADCSLKEDRTFKNKMVDIEIFLKTAHTYAKDGNCEKASKYYQIADKFTNDLTKKLTNKC